MRNEFLKGLKLINGAGDTVQNAPCTKRYEVDELFVEDLVPSCRHLECVFLDGDLPAFRRHPQSKLIIAQDRFDGAP